jgi:hypothetical protein
VKTSLEQRQKVRDGLPAKIKKEMAFQEPPQHWDVPVICCTEGSDVNDKKADDIVQTLFVSIALPVSAMIFALTVALYVVR